MFEKIEKHFCRMAKSYLKDSIVFVKRCSFEITIQDGGFHSSNFYPSQTKNKLVRINCIDEM